MLPQKIRKQARKARKPWVTKECLKAIRENIKLFQRFLKTRNPVDFDMFKQHRNKLNNVLRDAKKRYMHDIFNTEVLKRSDLVWKRLNTLLGRTTPTEPVSIITSNGLDISGKELADAFNDYFVSVANSSYNTRCADYLKLQVLESAFLTPTSAHETVTALTLTAYKFDRLNTS